KKAKDILYEKVTARDAEIEYADLPAVTGHADMIEQLVVNLLDNALKFQPQDQKPLIKIGVSIISGDDELGNMGEPGEQYLKLSVKDNGIGFEQNEIDRIFIMFERLHPKNVYRGSGMGLAMCRKIMDAHNGFITAESEPGQGSVFHCYVPLTGGGGRFE
ncbi:MAG: hypothetical protein JWN76_3471, partial [Chitinophagaceae bacterium]|nr:hypothetical protein [Chitinophagaceae bacterium]